MFLQPYTRAMAARNPHRIPRLYSLRTTPPGFVRLAVCRNCGHMAPLPLRDMIRRYGELFPIDEVLWRLRCEDCRAREVEMRLARLCDPGCRNWRG